MDVAFEARNILGLDIGGTKTGIGIVSEAGRIIGKKQYSTKRGSYSAFQMWVTDIIRDYLEEHGDICGVGIGIKAQVDFQSQVIVASSLFPDDKVCALPKLLMDELRIPVVIDNDVNVAAMAEAKYGLGRGRHNFVYVNVGTGVGLGIFADGVLLRGERGLAGEISGMLLNNETSGEEYRLESVASGYGIDAEARCMAGSCEGLDSRERAESEGKLTATELFKLCESGNTSAMKIADTMINALSKAVFNTECVLNAGFYILGGGVTKNNWYLDKQIDSINRLFEKEKAYNVPRVVLSELGGDNASVLGAAASCADYLK